jgi:hypothetical protein
MLAPPGFPLYPSQPNHSKSCRFAGGHVGIMKEYRLAAWPDLPAAYHRTTYRRMLSDMSHRFVTVQQLMGTSGATRMEVRLFLQMLGDRGLLCERDIANEDSLFGPLGGWLRRAFSSDVQRQ